MALIKQLSEATVNRIAAGEMVPNPAGAVKELVENAIDAGSTQISITLEAGGKNLIIVADNGCGILSEDLSLAVERHTTSKLVDDDLLNIHTLGFRGEALSAIAAVSKLKITTYCQRNQEALQLTLTGGQDKKIEKALHNAGTRVEVRDLFFATPARLKFLKSDKIELTSCLNVIKSLALYYQHITFQVYHNQREVLNLCVPDNDNRLYQRIHDILGREYAEQCVPIELTYEGIKVSGMISLPQVSKSSSDAQYLFVNGRPVKDKLLYVAIKVAYQELLPQERHPVVVIFIELNPYEVDVNVHPSKTEVRFQQSILIRQLLINAISEALHRYNVTPATQADTNNNLDDLLAYTSHSWSAKEDDQMPFFAKPSSDYPRKGYWTGGTDLCSANWFSGPQISNLGFAISVFDTHYLLSQNAQELIVTDLELATELLTYRQLSTDFEANRLNSHSIAFSERITMNADYIAALVKASSDLTELCFKFTHDADSISIQCLPVSMDRLLLQQLSEDLAEQILQTGLITQQYYLKLISAYHARSQHRPTALEDLNALLRSLETIDYQDYGFNAPYIKINREQLQQLFDSHLR